MKTTNFFKCPALHSVLCVCGGVSGPDFRNNTVVPGKKIVRNQPVEPPKPGIRRAAWTSEIARAGGGRRAGTCALPTPAAHNGVYGFGGEKRNRTVNPEGEKTSNPRPRSGQSAIVPVTNPMINGREEAARAASTSAPGWLRDSGAVPPGPVAPHWTVGGWGGGAGWGRRAPHPTPAPSLLCP